MSNKIKQALFKIYASCVRQLPASCGVRIEQRRCLGYWPNIKSPTTFSEKIQWRKLHGNHALFAILADKVVVKEHVRQVLGEHWITPSIWNGPELPSRSECNWPIPYVIKANHDSGSIHFVRSREEENWESIISFCRTVTRKKHPGLYNEHWYDLIKPQLLVEPYLGDNLFDYKFYVFGGRVHFIHIDTDRHTTHKRCFYDRAWERQDFTLKYPQETRHIPRPLHLDTMIEAAEELGNEFDFVRIDLYDLPTGPRFGEMTFAPGSGTEAFIPHEWDKEFGALWKLYDRAKQK